VFKRSNINDDEHQDRGHFDHMFNWSHKDYYVTSAGDYEDV